MCTHNIQCLVGFKFKLYSGYYDIHCKSSKHCKSKLELQCLVMITLSKKIITCVTVTNIVCHSFVVAQGSTMMIQIMLLHRDGSRSVLTV